MFPVNYLVIYFAHSSIGLLVFFPSVLVAIYILVFSDNRPLYKL